MRKQTALCLHGWRVGWARCGKLSKLFSLFRFCCPFTTQMSARTHTHTHIPIKICTISKLDIVCLLLSVWVCWPLLPVYWLTDPATASHTGWPSVERRAKAKSLGWRIIQFGTAALSGSFLCWNITQLVTKTTTTKSNNNNNSNNGAFSSKLLQLATVLATSDCWLGVALLLARKRTKLWKSCDAGQAHTHTTMSLCICI